MAAVMGVDSSTQSCKVVVRDADTGALIATGRASHPDGSEVDPRHWWDALQVAIAQAFAQADLLAAASGTPRAMCRRTRPGWRRSACRTTG